MSKRSQSRIPVFPPVPCQLGLRPFLQGTYAISSPLLLFSASKLFYDDDMGKWAIRKKVPFPTLSHPARPKKERKVDEEFGGGGKRMHAKRRSAFGKLEWVLILGRRLIPRPPQAQEAMARARPQSPVLKKETKQTGGIARLLQSSADCRIL